MHSPTEYAQFGYELGPACGFQSHQNRAATPLRTWRRWSAIVSPATGLKGSISPIRGLRHR